jgi:hypothetical protein
MPDYPPIIAGVSGPAVSAATIKPIDRSVTQLVTLVNVNSAATDVATFTGLPAKYMVLRVLVFEASVSLTLATIDLRTAAAGAGTAIVAAYALAPLTTTAVVTSATIVVGSYQTVSSLFVRNVTAQGAAATCSVILEIMDLT